MKTALHNIQYKTFFGNGTKNSSARQICRQYVNTALERTPDADYFTKSVTEGKMNFQGCNCNGLDSFTLKDFHNKKDKLEISVCRFQRMFYIVYCVKLFSLFFLIVIFCLADFL